MANLKLEHQITESEKQQLNLHQNSCSIIPVYNHKKRLKLLKKNVKSLTLLCLHI